MKKRIIVGILGFAAFAGLVGGGFYFGETEKNQNLQNSVTVVEVTTLVENERLTEISKQKKAVVVMENTNIEKEKTEIITTASKTTTITTTEMKTTELAAEKEATTADVSTIEVITKATMADVSTTEAITKATTADVSTTEAITKGITEKETEHTINKTAEVSTEDMVQKPTEAATQKSICEMYGHTDVDHYTTKTVHHKDPILLEAEWDEPIYEAHWFCNVCGLDLTEAYGDPYSGGALSHTGMNGCQAGWHNRDVIVDYIHHEEVWGWNEYDLYERVVDYQYCIDCNRIKEESVKDRNE